MSSKKSKSDGAIVTNRRARHDYEIEDTYEAGLVLTGTEVKSLREGRASLAEAFIDIDRRGFLISFFGLFGLKRGYGNYSHYVVRNATAGQVVYRFRKALTNRT